MMTTPLERRGRGIATLLLAMALALGLGTGLVATALPSQANTRGISADVTVTFRLAADGDRGRVRVACPEDRSRACRLLQRHADLLRPNPQRQCTTEYGGPERARVRGVVDGRKVDVVIARDDGCGISDWAALVGLLPAL
jgi:hypothetical protein